MEHFDRLMDDRMHENRARRRRRRGSLVHHELLVVLLLAPASGDRKVCRSSARHRRRDYAVALGSEHGTCT